MGRLIDADALKFNFVHGRWDDTYIPKTEVDAAPTVDAEWMLKHGMIQDADFPAIDAVPVVRCAECISFDKEGICQLHEINRSEDDFCSDGEVSEASLCDNCDERSGNCCWCKRMERSEE